MVISHRRSLAVLRAGVALLTLLPLGWGLFGLTARWLTGGLHPAAGMLVPVLGVGVLFGATALAAMIAAPRWYAAVGLAYFGALAGMMSVLLASGSGSWLVYSLLTLAIVGLLSAIVANPK